MELFLQAIVDHCFVRQPFFLSRDDSRLAECLEQYLPLSDCSVQVLRKKANMSIFGQVILYSIDQSLYRWINQLACELLDV